MEEDPDETDITCLSLDLCGILRNVDQQWHLEIPDMGAIEVTNLMNTIRADMKEVLPGPYDLEGEVVCVAVAVRDCRPEYFRESGDEDTQDQTTP